VETCEFAELLSKTEKSRNYILVIGRENIGDTISKMLSYSIDSILRFVVDDTGKKHYTEKWFEQDNPITPLYFTSEDAVIYDELEKSRESARKYGTLSTEEVRKYFANKRKKSEVLE
jgi:hypothetical protein